MKGTGWNPGQPSTTDDHGIDRSRHSVTEKHDAPIRNNTPYAWKKNSTESSIGTKSKQGHREHYVYKRLIDGSYLYA